MPTLFAVIFLGVLTAHSIAQEAKEREGPRIAAIAPVSVSPGETVTLLVRGLKLVDATAITFPGAPSLSAEIKSKKAAAIPTGSEAKDVGDAQLEAVLSVPSDQLPGSIAFRVETPAGATPLCQLRIANVVGAVEEKEPNNGFQEAQPCEFRHAIRATLQNDKDVDVFAFRGVAKRNVTAEIFAHRGGSLLDPTLTAFDGKGRLLASSDDALDRDARLVFELPPDGSFFVIVQDAHDRGSAWHAYELTVNDAP